MSQLDFAAMQDLDDDEREAILAKVWKAIAAGKECDAAARETNLI